MVILQNYTRGRPVVNPGRRRPPGKMGMLEAAGAARLAANGVTACPAGPKEGKE